MPPGVIPAAEPVQWVRLTGLEASEPPPLPAALRNDTVRLHQSGTPLKLCIAPVQTCPTPRLFA